MNKSMRNLKTHCNQCSGITNHEILYEHRVHYDPTNMPGMGIDSADVSSQIIRCIGCEYVSFREYCVTSEDWHPERGPEGTEYRYPKADPDDLSEKRYTLLPGEIRRIYSEIIRCYNQGLLISCTSLIRSIIEGIADESAVLFALPKAFDKNTHVSINKKVATLAKAGVFSNTNADVLQESRILGNRAIHELKTPSKDEIQTLIEIIEHTLDNVFEMPERSAELKWKRSKREKAKKSKRNTI